MDTPEAAALAVADQAYARAQEIIDALIEHGRSEQLSGFDTWVDFGHHLSEVLRDTDRSESERFGYVTTVAAACLARLTVHDCGSPTGHAHQDLPPIS